MRWIRESELARTRIIFAFEEAPINNAERYCLNPLYILIHKINIYLIDCYKVLGYYRVRCKLAGQC